MFEILFALRINEKNDEKSPFEKQVGRESNQESVILNVVGKLFSISECFWANNTIRVKKSLKGNDVFTMFFSNLE